jgi:hypothetical protein
MSIEGHGELYACNPSMTPIRYGRAPVGTSDSHDIQEDRPAKARQGAGVPCPFSLEGDSAWPFPLKTMP